MTRKNRLVLHNILIAVGLALVVAVNMVCFYWSQALDLFLGEIGGSKGYATGYEDSDVLRRQQELFASQVTDEGSVLLYNEGGALPLSRGARVTVFSQNSINWLRGGSGSGEVSTSDYAGLTVRSSLEAAGFTVNDTVWKWYQNTSLTRKNWNNYESDWAAVRAANESSFADYNDAAIFILTRAGGEGSDPPRVLSVEDGGDGKRSYMELTDAERGLLRGAKEAGFQRSIVILNTGNAMQMDFLKDESLGVDAVLWMGQTGVYGLTELGKILSGAVNPSGHLTATYVYDVMSAPAMQNFGNAKYLNSSIQPSINYSFVNYAEGIYVGYKYYETRYEDVVMGAPGAGSFDYDSVVAYPFGFGGSYTSFAWSNFHYAESDGTITVKVDVKNTGSVAGKDAVGVYFQAPYTDYDRENRVEKASVNLAGFAKTRELKAGESQTVTISFPATEMKSYDFVGQKAYILDEGDYYVTAAQDAHEAVNNILAAKGYRADGDAAMTGVYRQAAFETLQNDGVTGTAVTNRFDDAVAEDAVYLTRANWTMMDRDGLKYATGYQDNFETREADDGLIARINEVGWEYAARPASEDIDAPITTAAENGLMLADLAGKAYDDPDWERLIDNLKVSEMHGMFSRGGYSTAELAVIGKPRTYDYDGPSGLNSYVAGWGCFGYPVQSLLGATWNTDLADRYGEMVGEDALRSNTQGWYAPILNIMRTPFTGRSYESYAEDALMSGKLAAAEVRGAAKKGLYVYLKHFALNDQETNRQKVCTWAQEQAIREIYLRPFEIAVKEGGATGIMASMNRIGYRYTAGSYPLLTQVLRNEWGFRGAVITDYVTDGGKISDQRLAAGVDLELSTNELKLTSSKSNVYRNALRNAAHNVCWMVLNSNAMETAAEPGFPIWLLILIIFDALALIGLIVAEIMAIRVYRHGPKQLTDQQRKRRRIIRTVVIAVLVIALAIGGYLLYSYIMGKQI